MSLKNIDKIFLDSVKTALTGEKVDFDFNEIDFNDFFNVADKHSVNMLCFEGIQDNINSLPQDVYYNWVYYASRKMTINENVLSVQKKLTKLLEDNNIKYFVFKGLAIASYYKKYELRELGDIDFYIDYSDFEKANKILKSNNFELVSTNSSSHWHYVCDGVDIEMHYDFWKMPDNKCSNELKSLLHNTLNDTKRIFINDYGFETPNAISNAVILILHIINHLQNGGIGLRHICDFSVFYSSDDFKKSSNEIIDIFKKGGIFKTAKVIANISHLYLGAPLYSHFENVDKDMIQNFLLDILNSGNFGALSKESYYGSAIFTMNKTSDNGLFKSMFAFCKLAWPLCEKHKILLPIAPIYVGVRYIFRAILGKRPKINPFKYTSTGLKRASFYRDLKFYEEE